MAAAETGGVLSLGEAQAAAAARRLGLHYLQRYFYLIAFRWVGGLSMWGPLAPRPPASCSCPRLSRVAVPMPDRGGHCRCQ